MRCLSAIPLFTLSFLLVSVIPRSAEALDAVGWLERSQAARFPTKNMQAQFTIEIVRADGGRLERKGLSVRASREKKLADRLFVITEPLTIAGMALLSKDILDGPADQWLYLPAYRRARRVAIHGAGDAFVGSDFYYADLARVRIEAGDHSMKGEVSVAGRACVKIETLNKDPLLPYARTVTVLDKENALPLRTEYYDGKGVLLKVGTIDSIELRDGHPTPVRIAMRNVVLGSSSRILLDEVQYDVDLDPEMFTVERLEDAGLRR
jgi:hypothetical protein